MRRRLRIGIALLAGCLAGLSGPAVGENRIEPVVTVRDGETAGQERRLSSLRQERRMRRRATALLSEVALFDEGVTRGRSVSVEAPIKAQAGLSPNQRQFSLGDEAVGIGGSEGGGSAFGADLERVEAEIRTLERRLQALKEGIQRP
ncbi:MAG: hypothetical protein EXS64_12945 [Candidatus Latescibacteria bacterium]|nr:hypothetical protein [Candidatus Latescibacterota bacterium]